MNFESDSSDNSFHSVNADVPGEGSDIEDVSFALTGVPGDHGLNASFGKRTLPSPSSSHANARSERPPSAPDLAESDLPLSGALAAGVGEADLMRVHRIKDLDSGREYELMQGPAPTAQDRIRELGTGRDYSLEEFDRAMGLRGRELLATMREMRAAGAEAQPAPPPPADSLSPSGTLLSKITGAFHAITPKEDAGRPKSLHAKLSAPPVQPHAKAPPSGEGAPSGLTTLFSPNREGKGLKSFFSLGAADGAKAAGHGEAPSRTPIHAAAAPPSDTGPWDPPAASPRQESHRRPEGKGPDSTSSWFKKQFAKMNIIAGVHHAPAPHAEPDVVSVGEATAIEDDRGPLTALRPQVSSPPLAGHGTGASNAPGPGPSSAPASPLPSLLPAASPPLPAAKSNAPRPAGIPVPRNSLLASLQATEPLARAPSASSLGAPNSARGAAPASNPLTSRAGEVVKVSVNRKTHRDLSDLRLVQALPHAHEGVVWVMRFSRDGRFLATAGQDGLVKVWEVLDRKELSGGGGATAREPDGLRSEASMPSPSRQSKGGSLASQLLAEAPHRFKSLPSGPDSPMPRSSVAPPRLKVRTSGASSNDSDGPDGGADSAAGGGVGLGVLGGAPPQASTNRLSTGGDSSGTNTPRGGAPGPLQLALSRVPSDASLRSARGKRLSALRADPPGHRLPRIPVLKEAPVRVFSGHAKDVLDLSWSKSKGSDFLLSASMDMKVRLWHVSLDECLRVFDHTDFVTGISFFPSDDKYFLSGSIDGKVRLWNIPEQRVVDWAELHDMVTAVTFNKDGRKVIAGTMKGQCRFFHCEGAPPTKLESKAQVDVRNSRKGSRGRKITGLAMVPLAGDDRERLLVTSNDSRIRMYEEYNQRLKFKGHKNANSQIKASHSAHGEHVICGSDDGSVFVWPVGPLPAAQFGQAKRDKVNAYEVFQAHADTVTCAIFAPSRTRRPFDQIAAVQPPDTLQRLSSSMAPSQHGGGANAPPSLEIPAGRISGHPLDPEEPHRTSDDRVPSRAPSPSLGMPGPSAPGPGPSSPGAGSTASSSPFPANFHSAAHPLLGAVIVTAGFGGEIRIFENLGARVKA